MTVPDYSKLARGAEVFTASAPIGAHTLVTIDPANPYKIIPATAGGLALGVALNGVIAAGYPVYVCTRGRARLIAGEGGLATGATVAADPSGKGVATVAGNYVPAIVLSGAVAGALADVMVGGFGKA